MKAISRNRSGRLLVFGWSIRLDVFETAPISQWIGASKTGVAIRLVVMRGDEYRVYDAYDYPHIFAAHYRLRKRLSGACEIMLFPTRVAVA